VISAGVPGLGSDSLRRQAPVFVLGSPRSGTTLLYDMLLSAGGFAVYLAESNVFNLLGPRFGDLSSRKNRERLLDAWLESKLFRASGLEADHIRRRILRDCHNSGEFLSIVMAEICVSQGVNRWAENSPEAMLYLPLIKQFIPEALVIHIIRDGRDVANSLGQLQYVHPFPWEERYGVVGCGLYWEWIVRHGRNFGMSAGTDYIEIHFEELLAHPRETLDQIGRFIDQSLSYEIIQRVAYGSVSKPNTSFQVQDRTIAFNPVGRWKKSFSPEQLLLFERLVGRTLQELGYSLATEAASCPDDLYVKFTRLLHRSFFDAKFWYKNNFLLRALRQGMKGSDIDEIALAEDHPPPVGRTFSQSS
jgi:Sulfotransferase family